jgi:hypothetical protein
VLAGHDADARSAIYLRHVLHAGSDLRPGTGLPDGMAMLAGFASDPGTTAAATTARHGADVVQLAIPDRCRNDMRRCGTESPLRSEALPTL